jgi:hypothetical protein
LQQTGADEVASSEENMVDHLSKRSTVP